MGHLWLLAQRHLASRAQRNSYKGVTCNRKRCSLFSRNRIWTDNLKETLLTILVPGSKTFWLKFWKTEKIRPQKCGIEKREPGFHDCRGQQVYAKAVGTKSSGLILWSTNHLIFLSFERSSHLCGKVSRPTLFPPSNNAEELSRPTLVPPSNSAFVNEVD